MHGGASGRPHTRAKAFLKLKGFLEPILARKEMPIRAFGSNSIATLFRSEGVSYLELATDAGKKLDGKLSESLDISKSRK